MEVVYNLTPEDMLFFVRAHLLGANTLIRWFRRLRWVFMIVGCILFALWFYVLLTVPMPEESTRSTFGPSFIIPLLLVLSPVIYNVTVEARLRAGVLQTSPGIVGEIRLVLTDQSITEITEVARTEVQWKHVLAIGGDRNYSFIYVTPGAAVIVPRHGFRSDEEYERTREFALQCFNRNRP